MDIVIASTDKFRIDTGGETRVTLENATGHGLLNKFVNRWEPLASSSVMGGKN